MSESFFDAIERHRRAAWRVTIASRLVNAIGDTTSLEGGTLIQTPLRAGNRPQTLPGWQENFSIVDPAVSIHSFNWSSTISVWRSMETLAISPVAGSKGGNPDT